jgi:hypothetical protein
MEMPDRISIATLNRLESPIQGVFRGELGIESQASSPLVAKTLSSASPHRRYAL